MFRPIPLSSARSGLILACLLATWVIWGSTYLAIRIALPSLPPFLQTGTRFLAAGALLLAWMRGVRKAPWPTALQWRNALLLGTLMLAGGTGGTAYSEQTVGSGLVVLFVAVVPILMALGNLLWRIYPSPLEAAGILAGLTGVLCLTQGAGFSGSPVGLAAQSLASLAWAAGSLLSQRGVRLAPGAMGFASQMLAGGCVLLALSVWRGEWQLLADHGAPSVSALAAWAYLVVFGSLVAFNAYMVLLERASSALASSYCFVNPVIAMLLGVWIGGEHITPYEWSAASVVLFGVVLVMAARSRVARAAA